MSPLRRYLNIDGEIFRPPKPPEPPPPEPTVEDQAKIDHLVDTIQSSSERLARAIAENTPPQFTGSARGSVDGVEAVDGVFSIAEAADRPIVLPDPPPESWRARLAEAEAELARATREMDRATREMEQAFSPWSSWYSQCGQWIARSWGRLLVTLAYAGAGAWGVWSYLRLFHFPPR